MARSAATASVPDWVTVPALPRLCDVNNYSEQEAKTLSANQDMLPVGVFADGITPLFLMQSKPLPVSGYHITNDSIGSGTGYQIVSRGGGVKAAHLIPFPSLTRKGMISLYRKILDGKVPIPMSVYQEQAILESTWCLQYNCRRREHVALRGWPAGFERGVYQGYNSIPDHYKPFVSPTDPNLPYFAGIVEDGEPASPFSFIYAFCEEDLKLTPDILARLTALVDDNPEEFLHIGVCQVALLNYVLYERKWDELKDKFNWKKPVEKVDQITFIIAFHHLLGYTEWNGVVFHANPFRFATAFTSHEKKMRRPVPGGSLKDGLEEDEANEIEAQLAQLKYVDPVSPLLPSDLDGSKIPRFERPLSSFKPFSSSVNPALQNSERQEVIEPTLEKLGHVRNIGNPNYLSMKYTHRLIPARDVKPQHKPDTMWTKVKSFPQINEYAYSRSWRVMFPACELYGATCQTHIDVLVPNARVWSGHATRHHVHQETLQKTLRLCCSTANELEGPVPPPPPPGAVAVARAKRSASDANLDNNNADQRERARKSFLNRMADVKRWVGGVREPAIPVIPVPDYSPESHSEAQAHPKEKLISQEGVLKYLQAKGHREGVDYKLVDGVPVPITEGIDDEGGNGGDDDDVDGAEDDGNDAVDGDDRL